MATQVLSELKRRNVVRVGGVYAVTAWALFQIAKTVLEVLELPKWSTQLVFVLLTLGLPIAMIIAWAFERAPEGGLQRTTPATPGARLRFTPLDVGVLAGLAVVIGLTAAQLSGITPVTGSRATLLGGGAPTKSVAVLPFISFSPQRDAEFFADGLTEEVINSLAQAPDLKVAGRTSAFYFKGKNEDLREIGRKLGVAHVVEGSVRREGDKLRVTAQLVSVADGFHLWSKTYDRRMDDAFAIQTEIAQAVAEALKTRLKSEAVDAGERDPEAYQLQLTARAHMRRMNLDDLQAARSLYERLTAVEPNNASAWAGYARSTMLLAQNYLTLDFGDARSLSEAALDQAMKLAPNNVEAWLARAYVNRVLWVRESDPRYLREEQQALSRVLALDPRNAEALSLQAVILSDAGDHARAIAAARQSLAIDPMNRLSHALLARALRSSGQLEAAAEAYRRTIELFPEYDDAKLNLGSLLVEQGQLDKAEPWLRLAAASGRDAAAGLALAHVYVNLGMPKDAAAIVAMVRTPPGADYAKTAGLAARGDYAAALAYARGRAAADPDDSFWPQAIAVTCMMTKNPQAGAAVVPRMSPSLVTPEPAVTSAGYGMSLAAAQLLSAAGDRAQARRIAEAVLRATAAAETGYASGDARIARVKAFALLGERERAISELAAAVHGGWRTPFEFETFVWLDQDPTTALLHQDPRFKDLLAQVRADLARQREQLLAERS